MCDMRLITAIRIRHSGEIVRGRTLVYGEQHYVDDAIKRGEKAAFRTPKEPCLCYCIMAPSCGAAYRYFDGKNWHDEGAYWHVKEQTIKESNCNTTFQMLRHHGIDVGKVEFEYPANFPKEYEIKIVFKDE